MTLKNIEIKDTYSSDLDNLINDFYNPVLENAIIYDRISGFFSPKVIAAASRGFAELISREGKIRLITSVEVDCNTYQLISGNRDFDNQLFEKFELKVDKIESQIEKDYLSVFSWLYNTGRLEMKIAVTNVGHGIMHQKVGLVTDADGKSISFSGSNNETVYGWTNNIEEFKVFKNWRIATASYYKSDRIKFDRLWANETTGVKVLEVDDAIKSRIVRITSSHEDIDIVVQRLKEQEKITGKNRIFVKKRELFDFQKAAIQHWFDNEYMSIFEMATGTGKTFTSINALKQFREKEGYLRALVVVPLTTLTIQWQNDIEEIIDDIQIVNTSVDSRWRETLHSLHLSSKLGQLSDIIIITTYSMFPRSDFQELIEKLGEDLILVTDEMHNLVTELGTSAAKNIIYKYKLGLSATPTRLWKPEESSSVAKLFGDNRFSYDISSALENGFLVPFNYYPIPVHLDINEYEDYVELSNQIRHIYATLEPFDDRTLLYKKLRDRAKIKKNSNSKIPALESQINKLQAINAMHHSLIYVDNKKFLKSLQIMLTKNNILSTKFIGDTPLEERLSTIDCLRTEAISAIVAIKCLDEGVDIPSAQTAFFLSNNTDPREYVQRLGRVLRIDRDGDKQHADVYDYLVMPPLNIEYGDDHERTICRNLIKGELIRAKFFEGLALNGDDSKSDIFDAIDKYGFHFEDNELEYNIEKED